MLSPLHLFSMQKRNKEIIDLLSSQPNIDLNAINTDANKTALMFASSRGHTSTIRLLLDRGADPTLVMNNGSTALHSAIGALSLNKQPAEDYYAVAELIMRYEKEKGDKKGLNLLNLPASTMDDRTLFRSLNRHQEIRTRILQIVNKIDSDYFLLPPTNPYSITPPTISPSIKKETPIAITHFFEKPQQSQMRYRGHSQPKEQSPTQASPMNSSKERRRTTTMSSFLPLALKLFSKISPHNNEYQNIPTNEPNNSNLSANRKDAY